MATPPMLRKMIYDCDFLHSPIPVIQIKATCLYEL